MISATRLRVPLQMTALAVLAICLIGLACARKPSGFSVTFKDARGLRPGQFLVYRGMRIGEVTNVALLDSRQGVKVEVRVHHDHADVPYREATYAIESPQVVNVASEKQVTMKDSGSTRTPVRAGDVLEGSEGMVGSIQERLSQFARDASEVGSVMAQKLSELAKSVRSSPEIRDLRKGMDDLAAEAGRRSKEEFERFRKERLPELEEKAKAYKQKLEREGKLPEAKAFWEQFTKWLDEARKP